jgi:hypothetical protein
MTEIKRITSRIKLNSITAELICLVTFKDCNIRRPVWRVKHKKWVNNVMGIIRENINDELSETLEITN